MAAKALDAEIKNDNRKVAGWLLYYHERKQEYLAKREGILHSSGPTLSDAIPGAKNAAGDPTGRKGQKLGDLQKTEQWLNLIEEVERRLPDKMAIFLKLRREYRHARGRNGWVAPVQHKYAQEMANLLGKKHEEVWIESRTTFYYWWERIVEYTARIASKRGLL